MLDELPGGWSEARVILTVAEGADPDRTALVLASLAPGRTGGTFRLRVVASGSGGPSPDAVRRALERLEAEGLDARLSLPGVAAFDIGPPAREAPVAQLAESWDALVRRLPADWSDLYAEVELTSSDEVDRAALLLGPVNPFLHQGTRPAFRFRSARKFGYGAAPVMARRCLARLDEAHVHGSLRLLRVLSDTAPVLTQGPVWRESGRAI
jgi:hypothetical protein